MRIIILVKEVPDTYGDRTISLETGLSARAASDPVLDEIGERAIEAAMKYAEAHEGVSVSLLSMGPEGATASIRKGLAMGADSAVHVVDDLLSGADLRLTAEVLAAALQQGGFDLVIAGNQSTDGAGGVIPAMLAELLGVPCATGLSSLEISAGEIRGDRVAAGATVSVRAALPAVVSITEALPDPRFSNFKAIMAAKKKPIEILTLADLGIDPLDPGTPRSIMVGIAERPPRASGIKIVDEGDAGKRLVDYLVENQLIGRDAS